MIYEKENTKKNLLNQRNVSSRFEEKKTCDTLVSQQQHVNLPHFLDEQNRRNKLTFFS